MLFSVFVSVTVLDCRVVVLVFMNAAVC